MYLLLWATLLSLSLSHPPFLVSLSPSLPSLPPSLPPSLLPSLPPFLLHSLRKDSITAQPFTPLNVETIGGAYIEEEPATKSGHSRQGSEL